MLIKILSSLLFLILCLPSLTQAYSTQDIKFETQDPEVSTGASAVTENAISQYSGLGQQDPLDTAVLVINWALTILGLIFVVLFVYAGILWMVSSGNEEQITKAKNILKAALIGVVIVLISYGTTYLIFNILLNATNSGV